MKKLFIYTFFGILLTLNTAFADVVIKFIAMNPSDQTTEKMPIRYDLPKGCKGEDVLDAGGFSLRYDIENDRYFIEGDISLAPKESKVFQIVVKDIWKVPDAKLDLLRDHIQDKMVELESLGMGDKSQLIGKSMLQRIEDIKTDQSEAKPIEERIKAYGANVKKLDTIESDMLVLSGIGVDTSQEKIITIVCEVTNKTKRKREYSFRHYFLPEVNSSDIVDTGGLELGYDLDKTQLYVHSEIELAPEEVKRYEIKVKDVWHIKSIELDSMDGEAKKIIEQLSETEYEKLGQYLVNEINTLIGEVRVSQQEDLTIEKRIATYKENLKRVDIAKGYLDKLRSFMLQFELARAGQEGKPTQDAAKQEQTYGGGKAEGKGGGIGSGIGTAIGQARGFTAKQRGGGVQGIRGLKGIILISRSLFKGWKPELATTWFIIVAVIVVLAVLAFMFYITNMMLSLRETKKKLLETKK